MDGFVESWPLRCPVGFVADGIKHLVKDKVVCDIGCASGDFIKAITPFCKKAIGIDIDQKRLAQAKKQNLEVYHHDVFSGPPEADIYFVWITPEIDNAVCKFLLQENKRESLILVNRRKENHWSIGNFGIHDKEVGSLISEYITVNYNEENSVVNGFPKSGEWVIGIIKNHE